MALWDSVRRSGEKDIPRDITLEHGFTSIVLILVMPVPQSLKSVKRLWVYSI